MRAIITDDEALRAVSVLSINAYLRTQGWEIVENLGNRGVVYNGPANTEAFAPGSERLGDYAASVSSVIASIARAEERDETSVYRDLVHSDRDVIRFRAPDAEDDGSISLLAGVDLVQQSKDALLAAACSAGAPQRYFRSGSNAKATEYLRSVKLGQTEHGSFVVNLYSPVPPRLADGTQATLWPDFDEEPFSRQVTITLMKAIDALTTALDEVGRGGDIEAFEAVVHKGVSSNLCLAIAGLIKDGDGLDFSLNWAMTRSAPQPRFRREFSVNQSEVLSEAARVLKERQSFRNEVLEGYVMGLTRDVQETEGTIKLKTFVEGQRRSVSVDLSAGDYRKAIEAHESKSEIRIEGDLEFEGQRYYLRNPRNIRIIEESEEL